MLTSQENITCPEGSIIAEVSARPLYDELHATAVKQSTMSVADMYYENLVEGCRKAAHAGRFEFVDEKMTREYFNIDTAISIPEGRDKDEYLDELYKGQDEAYNHIEADGIKVERIPIDIPVVFPPEMPPQEIRYFEYIRKTKECQVRLSWK